MRLQWNEKWGYVGKVDGMHFHYDWIACQSMKWFVSDHIIMRPEFNWIRKPKVKE